MNNGNPENSSSTKIFEQFLDCVLSAIADTTLKIRNTKCETGKTIRKRI